MLHVYQTKEKWQEKLSAVNHLDNKEVQTVKRSDNPLYYDLFVNLKS